MKKIKSLNCCILKKVFLCISLGFFSIGFAQIQYPNKSIRFIVPYPSGGGADIVARLIAQKLGALMGQSIIVDNKPGASTIIGTDLLAKSVPDGYTMGLVTDSHAINPSFFQKLPYDSIHDFEMISQMALVPLVLVANPSLKVKTLPELITLAKKLPGKISYASIGNGTPHNIAMEWLNLLAGIDLIHVPYKGIAPALSDVVTGQVSLMFTGTSTAGPYVKSGKLYDLAVSSAKRQSSFPDTPTVAEAAFPEFEFMTQYGAAFPAGTSKEIINRMNREISLVLSTNEVKEKLALMGVESAPSTPEDYLIYMKKQLNFFSKMIKLTGVKSD